MSGDRNPPLDPRVDQLHARLHQLNQDLGRTTEEARRRQRTTIGVGIALVALCGVLLTNASRQVFRLDPEWIAQVGRAELEEHLPSGREATKEYLVQESPQLVTGFIDTMVGSLPQVRTAVQGHINHEVSDAVGEFEQRLITGIRADIARHTATIEAAHPSLSSVERMKSVMTAVAGQFGDNFDYAMVSLLPVYSTQLDQLEAGLDSLSGNDRILSKREAIQREILEILICLVIRESNAAEAKEIAG